MEGSGTVAVAAHGGQPLLKRCSFSVREASTYTRTRPAAALDTGDGDSNDSNDSDSDAELLAEMAAASLLDGVDLASLQVLGVAVLPSPPEVHAVDAAAPSSTTTTTTTTATTTTATTPVGGTVADSTSGEGEGAAAAAADVAVETHDGVDGSAAAVIRSVDASVETFKAQFAAAPAVSLTADEFAALAVMQQARCHTTPAEVKWASWATPGLEVAVVSGAFANTTVRVRARARVCVCVCMCVCVYVCVHVCECC